MAGLSVSDTRSRMSGVRDEGLLRTRNIDFNLVLLRRLPKPVELHPRNALTPVSINVSSPHGASGQLQVSISNHSMRT